MLCSSFSAYKKNCTELYKSGSKISGVYTIDPDGSGPFDVYCDQTTARGRWTVFQKRLDGSVNFYRGWNDYKLGFGNLNGEFWLGLDKINRLTKSGRYRLRVDLEDTTGKTAYAEYDHFAVSSERTKYQLSLGTYSGEHSSGGFIKIFRFNGVGEGFFYFFNIFVSLAALPRIQMLHCKVYCHVSYSRLFESCQ